MKPFSIISNIKSQFSILFIFSIITSKIYCEETLDTKIKNICITAKRSVKSYFEEKQELPEEFKNLNPKYNISENELKTAIKFLLIEEEIRNIFILAKKK